MAQHFLLHLPDGTQYGPIDRETLEAWRAEGRVPDETLVWPEGAPEWMPIAQVLGAAPAPAAADPAQAPGPAPAPVPAPVPAPAVRPAPTPEPTAKAAAPVKAAPLKPQPVVLPRPKPAASSPEQTQPSARMPAYDGHSGAPSAESPARANRPAAARAPVDRTRLLLAAGGIALVVVLVLGMLALLRPFLANRRAIAEVRRYALADRRATDTPSGLTVELPSGWFALKSENPYVVRPGSRLALAQPAANAYGAVSVAVRPSMMDDLDAHLSELLQQRLGRQPSQKEGARSDVQLGKGRGRMVRTTFEEDLVPMQGATVAWADGYTLFSLEAWAPADKGDRFRSELETLCRGLLPSGATAARVEDAVERLAPEVPELSRDALRLMVANRLAQEKGVDDVPAAALRAVSRGLDALGTEEANEMRAIYQQIWAPIPEEQRVRLASLLNEVKAGRPVVPADGQALREAVRAGVNALPEDQRARLQELSGRAVKKSLLLP
jgi:GYF domain 2